MKTVAKVLAAAICIFVSNIPTGFCQTDDYLTPPGAPGSEITRMKTLNQIEPRQVISSLPYSITDPGSYYLSATLFASSSNSVGILIMSDDVKLDLNGFAINGAANSLNGITVAGQVRHNITIRNGVVRGWQGYGINGTNASDAIMENVKAYCNGLGGIVAGENSLLENCISYGNGFVNEPPQPGVIDDGIRVGAYSTVKDCKSRNNRGAGIYASMGCKIAGCTAAQSQKANGIYAEDYCTIRDCTVMGNMNGGITVMNKCKVSDNTCGDNAFSSSSAGILVLGMGNRIEDNNLTCNFTGLRVQSSGNLIIRNSANGNTSDYQMGSGDRFGEILCPQAGAFSNSNPWSNFRF